MDTSEIYIKMADCPEIQGIRPYHDDEHEYWAKDGEVWLPDQAQLQEMLIPEPYRDFRNLLSFFFDEWIDWNDDADKNFSKAQSMEQLWLAFVMKELHSKEWKDGWH